MTCIEFVCSVIGLLTYRTEGRELVLQLWGSKYVSIFQFPIVFVWFIISSFVDVFTPEKGQKTSCYLKLILRHKKLQKIVRALESGSIVCPAGTSALWRVIALCSWQRHFSYSHSAQCLSPSRSTRGYRRFVKAGFHMITTVAEK